MVGNGDITIRRLIVHTVDHRSQDMPGLSDMESPLTGEVSALLSGYVAANSQHKRARMGRFLQPGTEGQSARALCDDLLGDPGRFVARSRDLAARLFESMKGDDRVSPGNVAICTFAEAEQTKLEWLAVLKLDPRKGFVGEREKVDGGTRIVLRPVEGVVAASELQKCAFVLPPAIRQARGHDLIVLDQQTGVYGSRRSVASFFLKRFLECEIGYDNRERTRTFAVQSAAWLNRKEREWKTENTALFRQKLRQALEGHQVNVDAFAEAAIEDAQQQEEYLGYLKKHGLPELTFEPDAHETKLWTEFCVYRGDNGLEVKVRSEDVGPGKLLECSFDDATNSHRVVISTVNWQQVLRRGR